MAIPRRCRVPPSQYQPVLHYDDRLRAPAYSVTSRVFLQWDYVIGLQEPCLCYRRSINTRPAFPSTSTIPSAHLHNVRLQTPSSSPLFTA